MALRQSRDHDVEIPTFLKHPIQEHNLLLAIMSRAVKDLNQDAYSQVTEEHTEMARDFFLNDSVEPFTFKWICEHLCVNPDLLRKALCLN